MKSPVVAVICCILCYASLAQVTKVNKKDSVLISKVEQISYSLDQSHAPNIQKALPFSRVVVHDVRFDTSFIALHWQKDIFKIIRNQKLNLSGGFPSGISEYLNNTFNENLTENGSEMICYFKKFSITGMDTLIEDFMRKEVIFRVKVEVECFYKSKDSLFPAFKHDTTYARRAVKIKESFGSIVGEMLEPLVQKLIWMDSSSVVHKKSLTQEEVLNRYKERFNVPILTTPKYARGFYRNRQEFRLNKPSITEYSVKTSSTNIQYLVDGNGIEITRAKIYGFCDGKTIWLRVGRSWCPLYKVGNSFELFYVISYFDGYSNRSIKLIAGLNMDE